MTHLSVLRRGLRELQTAIIDSICPPHCPGCGELDGGKTALCCTCLAGLRERAGPAACRRCGAPRLRTDAPCQSDHRALRGIEMARAPFDYAGTAGAVVRRFKFRRDLGSGAYLARHMVRTLAEWSRTTGRRARFTAVPLHRRKRRQRGFDQAAWLAERIADRLELPFVAGGLCRVRETLPQGDPRVTNREANVHGAFAVRRSHALADEMVVLVDDVMTSGTTARECARVLRDAGARGVVLLTAARA